MSNIVESVKKFISAPISDELTADGLRQMFAQVRSDPEAGMGTLSQEDLLVDMVMRRWNVCIAKYRNLRPKQPAQLLKEPIPPMPSEATSVAFKAASAAKNAGM